MKARIRVKNKEPAINKQVLHMAANETRKKAKSAKLNKQGL